MNLAAQLQAHNLTPNARLLAPILERLARGYSECWSGNESLMRALKCCEKTVRNALDQLQAAGLVEIIRDYTLNSRRRIVLLWKRPRPLLPDDPSVTVNPSPQSEAVFTASSVLPPDPPIEVPEGSTGDETAAAANGEPAATRPDPSPAETQAVELWGDQPQVRASVREAESTFSPAWVARAVGECVEQARRSWAVPGLMWTVLRRWRSQGGPPPRATAAPPLATSAEKLAADEEVLAEKWAAEQRAWEAARCPLNL